MGNKQIVKQMIDLQNKSFENYFLATDMIKDQAAYQMSSSMNEGILEVVLTGKLTNRNVDKIISELIVLQKSLNTNDELIDVRKLKGRFDFSEADIFVKTIPSDKPKMNTAFVDTVENADYNSFYEIVTLNAGLSFKTFTDIDIARAWLKSRYSNR
ncbi:MAG: hypothetical protein JW976_14055 [Syntrophaceae bacterium]|nr:hypothetical protein [Syntrophaceae bacterium]